MKAEIRDVIEPQKEVVIRMTLEEAYVLHNEAYAASIITPPSRTVLNRMVNALSGVHVQVERARALSLRSESPVGGKVEL